MCASENKNPPSDWNWYRYVTLFAASSAATTLVTHPIDVVRVQMQSQFDYISPRQVLRQIIRYRGILGVYYGLVTAIQREFANCWLRFAFYEKAHSRGVVDSFWRKIQYASISGFLGGAISTPLTKIAIRIRADAAKSPKSRYNYDHVLHGLQELHKEGGFTNFYNMVKTCGVRGMLLTVWQVTIYDQVKDSLNHEVGIHHEWQRYLVASAIAGAITIIVITPIDVVEQIGHTLNVKDFYGERSIIRTISHLHGIKGFYRGLLLNIMRIPPQTMLTFYIYEQLNAKFPKLS